MLSKTSLPLLPGLLRLGEVERVRMPINDSKRNIHSFTLFKIIK